MADGQNMAPIPEELGDHGYDMTSGWGGSLLNNPHPHGTPEWHAWESANNPNYLLSQGMNPSAVTPSGDAGHDGIEFGTEVSKESDGIEFGTAAPAAAPTWSDGWATYTVDPSGNITYTNPDSGDIVTVTPSNSKYGYLIGKMREGGAFKTAATPAAPAVQEPAPRDTAATGGIAAPAPTPTAAPTFTNEARTTAPGGTEEDPYAERVRQAQRQEILRNAMIAGAGQTTQLAPLLMQRIWDPSLKENERRLEELYKLRDEERLGLSAEERLLMERTLLDPIRAQAAEERYRRNAMLATGPVRDAASLQRAQMAEQSGLGQQFQQVGTTIAGANLQAMQQQIAEIGSREATESEYKKALASTAANLAASMAPLLGMTMAAQPLNLTVWDRLLQYGYTQQDVDHWQAVLKEGGEDAEEIRSWLQANFSPEQYAKYEEV